MAAGRVKICTLWILKNLQNICYGAFKEQSPKIKVNEILKLREKLKYRRFLLISGVFMSTTFQMPEDAIFCVTWFFDFLKELLNYFFQKLLLDGEVSSAKSCRNYAKNIMQSLSCFL